MNTLRTFFVCTAIVLTFSCATASCAKSMKTSDYFKSDLQKKLAEASAKDQLRDIEKLLGEGAQIDYQGEEGMTALIWSLLQQNKRGYQYLLEKGADPNLQMTSSVLTSDGLTDGNSAVSLAAMNEDPWYLEIALKHGGNPNLVNPIKEVTPVFQCIMLLVDEKHPRLEQLKLLIAAGADLNAKDKSGFTPIMRASMLSRYDMVYIMLEAGADPTIQTRSGVTVGSFIITARTDPNSELYQWRAKVIDLLKTKGIDVKNAVPLRKSQPNTQGR